MLDYLDYANRLEREALTADRTNRPLLARKRRHEAFLARRAARAERTDPQPTGLTWTSE